MSLFFFGGMLSKVRKTLDTTEKLRIAVRDTKKNPELAKSHKPGRSWEWPKNSPALKEVRTVLSA